MVYPYLFWLSVMGFYWWLGSIEKLAERWLMVNLCILASLEEAGRLLGVLIIRNINGTEHSSFSNNSTVALWLWMFRN